MAGILNFRAGHDNASVCSAKDHPLAGSVNGGDVRGVNQDWGEEQRCEACGEFESNIRCKKWECSDPFSPKSRGPARNTPSWLSTARRSSQGSVRMTLPVSVWMTTGDRPRDTRTRFPHSPLKANSYQMERPRPGKPFCVDSQHIAKAPDARWSAPHFAHTLSGRPEPARRICTGDESTPSLP